MPEIEVDVETIAELVPKLDRLCQQLTDKEREQLALVLRAGSVEIARAAGLDPDESEVEAFVMAGSSIPESLNLLFATRQGGKVGPGTSDPGPWSWAYFDTHKHLDLPR